MSFRARHDDMQHSEMLRQAIPFQPDWLIEALGVVPIDPKQVTRMEPGENHQTVNLISELLSPSGQPVQKVVRVDQRPRRRPGPLLYDANQRLIAKADLGNFRSIGIGVIMPHLIPSNGRRPACKSASNSGRSKSIPACRPPHLGSPQQRADVSLE